MIERPTPREVPDRYPYMVVEMERGPHHMRIPSLMAVSKLVKGLKKAHVAVLASMQHGGVSNTAMLSILKESGPELAAALGALVGMGWYHETYDLETQKSPDVLAFGEAVYEELHGEGYTLSDIGILALTVIRAIWDHSQLTSEVQARAGFIFPMLGAIRSQGSTSGSTTSEAPSDSGN